VEKTPLRSSLLRNFLRTFVTRCAKVALNPYLERRVALGLKREKSQTPNGRSAATLPAADPQIPMPKHHDGQDN